MLTTDLVRVRRSSGRIESPPLSAAERARMLAVADQYVAIARESVGKTRAEFDAACDDVPNDARDYKLVKGLRKLIQDRCDFAAREDVDPQALRKAVFTRAAEARRAMGDADDFNADSVIAAAATELGAPPKELGDALFADLKENHLLTTFDPISGRALVAAYEMAQKQAILLRAVRVVVTLNRPDPGAFRLLFRRMKFHRLLYRASRLPDGAYRIEIDGPFSLFRSVTKYGLQLALLLPVLEESGEWEMEADVLWGAEREPFRFRLEGDVTASVSDEDTRLPDDVAQLRDRFERLESPWRVEVAHDLLDLPGVGVCVPDLIFTHEPSGYRVYLEAMGYWSRDAVWRRVELVEAGLSHPIIFAVSSRLRVSEEVLGDDLPGQLYVYKGVISAKAIRERLDMSLPPSG